VRSKGEGLVYPATKLAGPVSGAFSGAAGTGEAKPVLLY